MKDFRARLPEHLDQLAADGGPIMITRHGRPAAVLLSPRMYDDLMALVERAGDLEALRKGREDIKAGRGREAKAALKDIARRKGLHIDR